jgi:hypothetical protein
MDGLEGVSDTATPLCPIGELLSACYVNMLLYELCYALLCHAMPKPFREFQRVLQCNTATSHKYCKYIKVVQCTVGCDVYHHAMRA